MRPRRAPRLRGIIRRIASVLTTDHYKGVDRLMEIQTIGVIGAGAMGSGIAQVCATAGYRVIMQDRADEYIQRGLDTIRGSVGKFVEKGKMSAEDRDALLGRLQASTALEDLAAADLVIEAVFENF